MVRLESEHSGVPTQMVITVRPVPGGDSAASRRNQRPRGDAEQSGRAGNAVEPLTGDLANMQLFVLLDDSTQSASLGDHLAELKTFLQSLPATTQVGIGYMRERNLRSGPGVHHGPSESRQSFAPAAGHSGRKCQPVFRAFRSGEALAIERHNRTPHGHDVDRRHRSVLGHATMDDPYVDTSIHDALKQGVMVYSIYLRGAGLYGRNSWVTNFGQSHLIEVSQETGGNAYFEAFSDPVNIAPFLSDFQDRLANQYRVTVESSHEKGVQPVKLRTELPGLKIDSPTRIYVR